MRLLPSFREWHFSVGFHPLYWALAETHVDNRWGVTVGPVTLLAWIYDAGVVPIDSARKPA